LLELIHFLKLLPKKKEEKMKKYFLPLGFEPEQLERKGIAFTN